MAASAQRRAKWQRRMPQWLAPHAHTPLVFQLAHARLGNPHATAPEVSYKDLRQCNFYWDVLLEEVASGQITSLGLFPCRQWALKGSESSGAVAPALTAASRSPSAGVLEEARLAPGRLTGCVPSRKRCSCALHRPFPASCAAAVPGTPQMRSPRHTKSLEISTVARDR